MLFIPYAAKKHTTQNTLFLIISIVGMSFFIIKEIDIGAVTIWAVYVVFLMFSIVLTSRIHTFIFLAATLLIQVVLGIFCPEVSATIDIVQYLKRMFIIVLAYFAVRYLTNEYASKLRGYQRFSKKQETLEKISTNFISVNNENAKEKIDEMFEFADEILEFDHAYLAEFSEDYEEVTFLNTCVKDAKGESFPYHQGMKVKTATLPTAKALIDRDMPIMCEDIENLSNDESGEQKDFFVSRSVLSFFALPIKVGNDLIGMLVVEYFDRSDIIFRESRLNFLKILANILGDSRKKTLYEEMLYDFAYFDETTKLANRNMLKHRLDQMILDRSGPEKIAIFDIELENLRMIKDTFGHSIGEQVMIQSAAILKNLMNEHCKIARSGEGKFVIVLPFVGDSKQIEKCAKKIIASFSHPVSTEVGIEALFVVIRIGISVYPDDGQDADSLLKNADLAGYEAKGTNEKIVFYRERLERKIAENTILTNRLFKALQNGEFFLEFQPQISCDTGKTVGIEALLRWTIDGNKRIPPDRFIPILEQTGLIYDVGLWVLEQALKEHNSLVAKGFPPLRISVNLSIVQFQGEDFILDFSKVIEESRIDPKYIELEITESVLSENLQDTIDKLHHLKELGINIAIDDFGRGYSSLNRLKFVPFDRIKIDKDIIAYMDLERKVAPITEIIILLAKIFQAGITAEGVETKEQADFLRSIACDEIQGYYFSRPLSSEALEQFLAKKG